MFMWLADMHVLNIFVTVFRYHRNAFFKFFISKTHEATKNINGATKLVVAAARILALFLCC